MTDKTVRGRFVWHELMTPDSVAAQSFYSKVLGWKTQPSEQVESSSLFVAGSGPVGGTSELPVGAPHWLPYLGTEDLEESLEEAQRLGAKVVKEIETLPGGGRYAVLTDPQGATFGLYSSDQKPAKEKPAKRGEYSWHELATTDAKGAFDFYAALLGWESVGVHDMGDSGEYHMFGRKQSLPLGGIFNKPAGQPGGSYWLGYVRVKDVNQIVKKAKSAGGTVILDPMEVPGGDYVVQLCDPQGAVFAAHTLKADLASSKAEAAAADEPEVDSDEDEEPVAALDLDEDEDDDAPVEKVEKKAKPTKAKAKPAKAKTSKTAAAKAQPKVEEKKAAPAKAAKPAAQSAAKKSSAKKSAAKAPAAKKPAVKKAAGKKAAPKAKTPAAKSKSAPPKKAVKAVKAKAVGKKTAVKAKPPVAAKKKAAKKK